jgi:hypothetical protein
MKSKKQLLFEVIIDVLILAILSVTGWIVITDMLMKILLIGAGAAAIGYKVIELKNIIKNNEEE